MDSDILRKVQLAELEILIEVDRICRKHHIAYQLNSGTLLGAIRHKGFIPWDDDIDIVMPFPDYLRFCRICSSELQQQFFLQNFMTDNFSHLYAKVRKNGTLMLEKGQTKGAGGFHQGIWIDIFPIVGVNNDADWLKKNNEKLAKVKKFIKKVNSTAPWKQLDMEKKLVRLFPKRLLLLYADRRFVSLLRSRKNHNACCYMWGGDLLEVRFPIDLFDETFETEFEGRFFFAPKRYDEYLTIEYGDYMTLPPVEKRNGGSHTITEIAFDLAE